MAPLAEIGCLEGYYLTFPGFLMPVFTPQCAGGLRSGGSRVFSSPVAGSNSSWVRLAVERSAPVRVAPTRIALERSASERSAHMRSAPQRSARTRSALKRIALRRFVLSRFASISSASERSARTRFASERFSPERSGSMERFLPLREFQGALATLMAYWLTPFLGARLPLFRYDLPQRWGRLNLLLVHHAAPERVCKKNMA